MLEQVREIVGRYQPEDLEDLETIIYLGRLELSEPN